MTVASAHELHCATRHELMYCATGHELMHCATGYELMHCATGHEMTTGKKGKRRQNHFGAALKYELGHETVVISQDNK